MGKHIRNGWEKQIRNFLLTRMNVAQIFLVFIFNDVVFWWYFHENYCSNVYPEFSHNNFVFCFRRKETKSIFWQCISAIDLIIEN